MATTARPTHQHRMTEDRAAQSDETAVWMAVRILLTDLGYVARLSPTTLAFFDARVSNMTVHGQWSWRIGSGYLGAIWGSDGVESLDLRVYGDDEGDRGACFLVPAGASVPAQMAGLFAFLCSHTQAPVSFLSFIPGDDIVFDQDIVARA